MRAFGFSQITAVFTDQTDIYFARQQVAERMREAQENLPDGVEPIAYLCVGHPIAFRSQPMLEELHWKPRRALADVVHDGGRFRDRTP